MAQQKPWQMTTIRIAQAAQFVVILSKEQSGEGIVSGVLVEEPID